MHARNWILRSAGLSSSVLFLAGCGSQPAVGPVPTRATQVASSPTAQAVPASLPNSGPVPTNPAPGPAAAGFSLPIGGEITPAPATAVPATPASVPSAAPFGNDQEGSTIPVPPFQSQGSPGISPTKFPAGSPAEPQGHSIHLSAGIAVPQSLPDGTVMAISVDYSSNAPFHPSSRYALVIKSAAGEAVNEVKLEDSGNLSAFFLKLKPEHRPFSARIEEVTAGSQRRTVISNELPLKTDY